MPGKPKRPGGHGYGKRSIKCIGRRFKSQKRAVVTNEGASTQEEVCNYVHVAVQF